MVSRFTRLCSPCFLEGELKIIQINFLSLGYPGNLVSKVITRARNSTALKMIGPQKWLVNLKLPYLGNISEKFSKKSSKEINKVFSSTILYTNRPLSEIYKYVSPTQEKSN